MGLVSLFLIGRMVIPSDSRMHAHSCYRKLFRRRSHSPSLGTEFRSQPRWKQNPSRIDDKDESSGVVTAAVHKKLKARPKLAVENYDDTDLQRLYAA